VVVVQEHRCEVLGVVELELQWQLELVAAQLELQLELVVVVALHYVEQVAAVQLQLELEPEVGVQPNIHLLLALEAVVPPLEVAVQQLEVVEQPLEAVERQLEAVGQPLAVGELLVLQWQLVLVAAGVQHWLQLEPVVVALHYVQPVLVVGLLLRLLLHNLGVFVFRAD